jgi:hypothetical protein
MLKIITASAVALAAAGITFVIATKFPSHPAAAVQPVNELPLHMQLRINHGLGADAPAE